MGRGVVGRLAAAYEASIGRQVNAADPAWIAQTGKDRRSPLTVGPGVCLPETRTLFVIHPLWQGMRVAASARCYDLSNLPVQVVINGNRRSFRPPIVTGYRSSDVNVAWDLQIRVSAV